ncbi:MAG: alanine--glyoxylate aminotransferase family protein [Firmicutes bacterium]|nr:alanine--glyoxylate aminotransferase family protein [Bacillota bacterium]
MFLEKQYLHLPGPTPVPPRVLRALSEPMINHRGPEFKALIEEVTAGVKKVFQTENEVLIFPAAGTGGMEAAIVNFLSPGEKALVASIGVFGDRFADIARSFGIKVEKLDFPWGTAIDPEVLQQRIAADVNGEIKAVIVTHNETSTGVVNDLPAIRQAMGDHPALLIVDAISGLGAMDLQTDAWGLDVVVTGAQKAFMLPPGLTFLSVSPKAWMAAEKSTNTKYYWDVKAALKNLKKGQTPYTPALPLLTGLRESLRMIQEEGLPRIFARHRLMRDMVRAAMKALGLELLAVDQVASAAVTAVLPPAGIEANNLRKILKQKYNVVVAGGQQKLDNVIFRVGHLGYVQPLDMLAVIAAIEMALVDSGRKVELGSGLKAAQEVLLNSKL